jgi:hypothetical protein
MSTENENNVVHLSVVNNSVRSEGEAAAKLVVEFLREWANAIEKGEELAERAILVMHHKHEGDEFVIKSRRCNVDLLSQVGMMHLALADMCHGSVTADEEPGTA